jgi:hypothetical protein
MEKTWEFDTTIGQGSEIVTVVYEYEIDDDKSTYNESVKEVWFEGRDIVGCMSEEAYAELDMEGAMRFHEHKQNYKQTADYEP